MKRLSVVISAYNEEEKIEECLNSVSFAEEIIVINNSSTDKTPEIASKFTNKVYTQPNHLMLNINKNFGIKKASSDYVLVLDADEEIDDNLKVEIKNILQNNETETIGYLIPRKNIIFGKWIKHTGWYPDYQLRLFKNSNHYFKEQNIHEQIEIKGKTEKLTGHINHRNYETIEQYIEKLNRYTKNDCHNFISENHTYLIEDIIRYPKEEFLRRYFKSEGFKDGYHGLALSLLQSFSQLVLLLKIWETKKFPEHRLDINQLRKEFETIHFETNYWLQHIGTKNTFSDHLRNKIKNILIRTIRVL